MVYLIYIDESQDMDRGVGVFSALAIPVINWHEAIEQVIALRRELKQTDEIYINFYSVSGLLCIRLAEARISNPRKNAIWFTRGIRSPVWYTCQGGYSC